MWFLPIKVLMGFPLAFATIPARIRPLPRLSTTRASALQPCATPQQSLYFYADPHLWPAWDKFSCVWRLAHLCACQQLKGVLLLYAHFSLLEFADHLLAKFDPMFVACRRHNKRFFEAVMPKARKRPYPKIDKTGYNLQTSPPVADYPCGDDIKYVGWINAVFELAICKHPQQNLRLHNGFKTTAADKTTTRV